MKTGEAIGPYVIQGSLGSGGMGDVYRARDTRLGRDVALKLLSDTALTTDAARRRVLQEARAAAALSHPNIATIFDVLDTPHGPIIVMEYVPGESLAQHIARGPMPVKRSLEIATQISEGLADAHARGIIHRDLKPANIQITPDGKAKILDFGIARLTGSGDDLAAPVTSRTEISRIVGTPGYMAPEQLEGGRGDERTDIYAVGVLIYEMLTGRKPYRGADILSNALAVIQGGAPSVLKVVPATPPMVSALVERAMARDAGGRFQTARELVHELQHARQVIAGDSVTMLSPALGRRTISRNVLLAAVAALTLAVAGWVWVSKSTATVTMPRGAVFAVLPFRNSSGDAANDPIAVGLTDAIANRLSSLQSIRVLSLDQTRQAAGSAPGARNAPAAAQALGAHFVVDGDLKRSGPRLDVDVSLVDAGGKRRAAGHYTGDIAQVFDLHQRIAQGVITALSDAGAVPNAVAPSPAPTLNQQAFAEYEQAHLFLERPDGVDHAIRLFQSAIDKDNQFALAYAGLGQAYWAKYQTTQDPAWTSKATKAILDALRIDPDQPEVRLSLGVMYQGMGQSADGEKELRRVLERQPWNDDAHRLLAGIYLERGQWDAAVDELHQAIALRPGYWKNHSELGFAHYSAGRLDEAVKAYTRVVELQPDSALGFHMRGTMHQNAGRLAEALADYTRANGIRPRSTTFSNIATVHFWRGEYAQAADAYRQAIALTPNSPGLHANLGDTLQKLGKAELARASYRDAVVNVRQQLAVNEKDAHNVARLALYLAKLNDRTGADAEATKALALNGTDRDVLFYVAMVDALAGRGAEACRNLDQAVARGTSIELVRHADEFRVLEGCDAYERIVARR